MLWDPGIITFACLSILCGGATSDKLSSVAICINGEMRCMKDDTFVALKKNLISALDGDLFWFGPTQETGHKNRTSLLEAFGSTVVERRYPAGSVPPPVSGVHIRYYPNHEWYTWHNLDGCMKLISQHEERMGQRYQATVFARSDMHWFHPHPPLNLPEPYSQGCWIPTGGDSQAGVEHLGLNDRHLVCSRNSTSFVQAAWNDIQSGVAYDNLLAWRQRFSKTRSPSFPSRSAPDFSEKPSFLHKYISSTSKRKKSLPAVGNEFFLKRTLEMHSVRVRRFCSLGALRCSVHSHRDDFFHRNIRCDKSGFKFWREKLVAIANAAALANDWSRFTSLNMRCQSDSYTRDLTSKGPTREKKMARICS